MNVNQAAEVVWCEIPEAVHVLSAVLTDARALTTQLE